MKKIAEVLKKELNDINVIENASPPFIPSERAKVNVGYECNSKCFFCYYHISRLKKQRFSVETIRNQLDIFKRFGVRDVDFSGGEPSIHPNILELLQLALDTGFRNRCIITNGFKFSNLNFMKACIEHGLNDILISLHGDERMNDKLTGVQGSFKMTVKAIENAKAVGLKPRVKTVINSMNYKKFPELTMKLNNLQLFNHNWIGFKHCYEQIGADYDKTVQHSVMSPYLLEALGNEIDIDYINIRYIPFCFAKGHEKNISNYPQKIYDPLEWINTLLPMVDHYSEESFDNNYVDEDEDRKFLNNNAVNCNRFLYEKSAKCITCKNVYICDGFEIDYGKKYDIEDEANPYRGKPVKDPLYYRYEYYKRIYGEL